MHTAPGRFSRRSALGVLAAGAAGAAAAPWLASGPASADPGPDVQLTDAGTTVTLNNGLVNVVVTKATAAIRTLQLVGSTQGNGGFNLVSGSGGQGYTTFDYYVGTTRYSKGLAGASYRVVEQTADRVEIAMTGDNAASLPFVVEVHMALERGLPGIYCYMVFRYPDRMPDGLTIQQLRYAFAAGDASFQWFQVDDERGVQQRPSIQDARQWITLQDTTYQLPDGSVWSKYQNISNLEGDNHVFMISNGKVGMALVQASKEAFSGGPTKQELTCHDYNNGEILLWHPFTSHYGTPDLEPPKGWEKVFGPFFLHMTEGTGTDPAANVAQMWADAKAAAAAEVAKWPYAWVDEPLYAAADRATVSGKITIAASDSPEGAWVVLHQPGPDRVYQGVTLAGDDWQCETLGYTYSARADHQGKFTVPAVRPGTYALSAFVDGVLGEYRRTGVTVAGPHTNIGNMVWKPVNHGRTLWQIGTPNRSAGELHVYGGAMGFRKYLTWLEYPYEFPGGVDFNVDTDNPATSWNYFQPCYLTPGSPLQLQLRGTTQDHTLTAWKIRFTSDGNYHKQTATLDIALAASVFGTLAIDLNGQSLATFDPLPGPPGDNSSYRLACRGVYRQLPAVTFPASLIRCGQNVLTLSPTRAPLAPLTRGNTVDDWMEPMGGVMYDVIRLQVG